MTCFNYSAEVSIDNISCFVSRRLLVLPEEIIR